MKIPYGKNELHLELPDFCQWTIVEKKSPPMAESESDIIQKGITSLLTQLGKVIKPGCSILVVVPDHTRKCNLPALLPPLLKQLEDEFSAHLELLIANGSHVMQPESMIENLVSPQVYQRYHPVQHDSRDEKQLVYCGMSPNGIPILLNAKVKQADFIITVGGILYHYFAGFGGGPKMLLPGIAGYETIRQNHALCIDRSTGRFHSRVRSGNLTTNPVYLDLAGIVDIITNVLSLQVVLSPDNKIVICRAGPIRKVQEQLIPTVESLYATTLSRKADIVIAGAGGYPTDINLIQSHKSIHHAFQCLRDDGVLIVLAECREGIGSKTFTPYFEHPSAEKMGEALVNDFHINGQTALSLKEKSERATIILVSELSTDVVENMGMRAHRSMKAAIDEAKRSSSNLDFGYCITKANITVPVTAQTAHAARRNLSNNSRAQESM